jgi:hypothetical protein
MSEIKEDDAQRSQKFRFSEPIILLILSIASYIYTYSSQRAYLRSFGIDEIFVSVEIDAVVRAGGWLAALALLFYSVLQLPTKLVSRFFQSLYVLEIPLLLYAIFYAFYASSGFSWTAVIFFLLGSFYLFFELIFVIRFIRKKGSFEDYFFQQIEESNKIRKKSIGEGLAKVIGRDDWILILILIFMTYSLGSLIGSYMGDRKSEFMQFQDSGKNFLIIQRVSGSYLAVGYEEQGDTPPIVSNMVKIIQPKELSEKIMVNKKFETNLIRKPTLKRRSFEEWYQKEFLSLFINRPDDSPSPTPSPHE